MAKQPGIRLGKLRPDRIKSGQGCQSQKEKHTKRRYASEKSKARVLVLYALWKEMGDQVTWDKEK